MTSATARFFSLLSTPFTLNHLHLPRPSLLCLSTTRLFLSLPASSPPLSSPHRRFHFNAQAQSLRDDQFNDSLVPSPSSVSGNRGGSPSPWPEWCKLVNSFNFSRYSDRVHGDLGFGEFVDDGEALPGDFVRAAIACLAFAREHEYRLWSLPRKDIEVVIENGWPFLFKDAEDSMRRMKLFLNGSTYHVLGSDKPSTVDLMKFLLSYASTTLVFSKTNSFSNREIVEASVRRLLSEFAEISGSSQSANPGSLPKQFPGTNGRLPGSSEQQVQMKRGDWICPRCRFMNFARNMKCLECEERRPKRQLTGGEWECPQCDFFNYGRNLVCLRCDCKKPGAFNPAAGSGYNNYSDNGSSDKRLNENQEKPQSWFSKTSQLENTASGISDPTYKAFPETMPLKEGIISETNTLKQSGNESLNMISEESSDISGSNGWDNKFMGYDGIRSSTVTPKSSSPQCGNTYNSTTTMEDKEREQDEKSERWFKRVSELHDVKDLSSAVSDEDFPEIMPMRKGENRFVVREKKDRSLTSPLYKRRMAMKQSESNNYVPFVPFPPNHFAKDKLPDEESKTSEKPETRLEETSQPGDDQKAMNQWRGSSLEGSAVKEPDPLDMSEEAKAERWFRRVAQIKDIKELSEIPDEDFPTIMPMRKGVNRFVVSKRKTPLERRLASSQYRRNLPVVNSDPQKKNIDSTDS